MNRQKRGDATPPSSARPTREGPLVDCPAQTAPGVGMGTWLAWGSEETGTLEAYIRCSWCEGTGQVPEGGG